MSRLNIPEKIKTFPVTKIRCTFGSGVIDKYCEYAGITMPLLEELGENAFAWVKCESEVEIPPTVNVIGRNCFYAAKLKFEVFHGRIFFGNRGRIRVCECKADLAANFARVGQENQKRRLV